MKFYAVRKGRETGIFVDWEKCKASVFGFKGAEYKSFPELKYAKQYLNENSKDPTAANHTIGPHTAIAYCDGSYVDKLGAYGSGLALLSPEREMLTMWSCSGIDPEYAKMRNVAGELIAAKRAMELALQYRYKELILHYDYQGVANWCTGAWEAKQDGTQAYVGTYNRLKDAGLKVIFDKIKAHSGNTYNDLADALARYSLGISSGNEVMSYAAACYFTEFLCRFGDKYKSVELGMPLVHDLMISLENYLKRQCYPYTSVTPIGDINLEENWFILQDATLSASGMFCVRIDRQNGTINITDR